MESEREDAWLFTHSLSIHLLNTHSVSKATVGCGDGETNMMIPPLKSSHFRSSALTTDTEYI